MLDGLDIRCLVAVLLLHLFAVVVDHDRLDHFGSSLLMYFIVSYYENAFKLSV